LSIPASDPATSTPKDNSEQPEQSQRRENRPNRSQREEELSR
jgi:two-component system sensor histidine kinase SenX3